MKRRLLVPVIFAVSVLVASSMSAAEEAQTDAAIEEMTEASAQEDAASTESEPLADNIVTTKHTAVIGGKELAYTANTGTMLLETGGETCEIFFTAYTLDDVEDPADRPVTFAFNGGPGSASYVIHTGCLGPRRIDVDDQGYTTSIPAKMKDNDNSLLDLTDLVIIDAVGTGYSRAVGDSEESAFLGYDNDNRTFGDFIYQYINRNGRWGSEKYVAGESYGTTRAVGVCAYLADTYDLNLNGLILISSINDFSAVQPGPGNEIPYALYLPTFAADARYQGVIAQEYLDMELEDFLDEVRTFAEEEYVPALFKGDNLAQEEHDALVEKLAAYTGLSKEFIERNNLRVKLDDFCAELLADKKQMVGRYDGRIAGPVTSGSLDDGASDPSDAVFSLGFGNTFNAYLKDELGFTTDRTYIPMSDEVNDAWTFPISNWGGYLTQEQTIYECMSKNPFLKIWVLCGYYDAATPFYQAEWVFNHVFLDDSVKDNLSFTYYPCGHMIYMEKESFDQFRSDAENWFGA